MSLLAVMKSRGIPLPAVETEDGLTAKDIMDKMRSFYRRFEKCDSEIGEYAESYFLELLYNYPKSMCNRHMTDALKQLIALIYFDSKPDSEDNHPVWNGFSYEDLSIMFDVSKATVHEAIRQKEGEARQLLEEAKLRVKAKAMALEELVKEEKMKLLEEKNKETEETKETNEQTLA